MCASLSFISCDDKPSPKSEPISPPSASIPTSGSAGKKSLAETGASQSLLTLAPRCQIGYRGLVLDLGDPSSESLRLFRLKAQEPARFTTSEGESFRVLDQMVTDFIFWAPKEEKDFEVRARMMGRESERVAVYLDDIRLGASKLDSGELKTVSVGARELLLKPGQHKLSLHLSRPKGGTPEAEVSWLRLGSRELGEDEFPSTRREIFSEVSIGDTREPSIILPESGSVRCPVFVPDHTQLKTKFGIWGAGSGEVEIVAHSAQGSQILASRKRSEEDPRDFVALTADLSAFGGQRIDLELRSPAATRGARIALGEPRLQSAPKKQAASGSQKKAKRAIVIILAGLGEQHIPPSAGSHGLPVLNEFAAHATSIDHYRLTTTSATGLIASLLTGLAPYEHGLSDSRGRLPIGTPHLAGLVEADGGRSSFFTGVPTSFGDFGFDRGFERYEVFAPQQDLPATEPLRKAQEWLSTRLNHEGPVISFIHLRGGHPPFDVSKSTARELAPKEYGGDLSPRRAAIQLGEVRRRPLSRHRRMPDEDWVRLAALRKAALLRQSAALSDFFDWLRKQDAFDESLVIVTGDIASGDRPEIPFDEQAPLSEGYLAVPLFIKFPGSYLQGQSLQGQFAPRDVTATLRAALSLQDATAGESDAIDLGASNATEQALLRPHVAYRGDTYSVRTGDTLLVGQDGKAPRLCRPTLDPACLINRADQENTQTRALWLEAWSTLALPLSRAKKLETPPENELLDNALIVWGEPR